MIANHHVAARWLERALLVLALAAAAYSGGAWWQMRVANAAATRIGSKEAKLGTEVDPAAATDDGNVIGRIEVPALHLSAPITNGIGKLELIRGVGHIPGTAVAGGLGTMALAGHRDTFFRGLRTVSRGMQIRVTGNSGLYRYQVDSTKVVTPDQVEVLEIGSDPALVLITCYPFNYIGAAPKRFIVHARLLSAAPDNEVSQGAAD